jgi:GTP-binding protein
LTVASQTFVDEAEIVVSSGNGGDGCVSFRREKFEPRGGPDGGDGGRGGDVVLVATRNENTLLAFRSRREFHAQNGKPGSGGRRSGADGETIEIRVPVGTVVYARDSDGADGANGAAGELPATGHDTGRATARESGNQSGNQSGNDEEQEADVVVDLSEDGQRFVVARGGRGGKGNTHFKSSRRQSPEFAQDGAPGEAHALRLSLKLLADVGLVGFPNAGKSTLIAALSAARPRVASYPFTTLVPTLGVVELFERRFVVADIPGLIEGASEGVGLGDRFLRHVERTRVLVHLIDLGAMVLEGRDPEADYETLRKELGRYRPELLERREIVLLNKLDLFAPDDPRLQEVDALEEKLRARGCEVLRASGATKLGTRDLVVALVRALDEADAAEAEQRARAEDASETPPTATNGTDA